MYTPSDKIKTKTHTFSPVSDVDVEFVICNLWWSWTCEFSSQLLCCYFCIRCDAMPLQDYVTDLHFFTV